MAAWTYRDGRVWDGDRVVADEVMIEDGRMIVAAPELLAALKAAQPYLAGPDELIEMVGNLIEKAEGK